MGIFDDLRSIVGGGAPRVPTTAQAPGAPGPLTVSNPFTMSGGRGFGDRLNDPLTQAGLALLANHGTRKSSRGAFEGVGEAVMAGTERQETKAKENQTLEYLRREFPDLSRQVDAGLPIADAFNMAMREKQFGQELALSRERLNAPTSDMQNFRDMQANPAFAGYMGARYGGEGGRAPSGYRWSATGDLEAIPGGPAASAGRAANAPSGFRWADAEQTRLEPIPGGPGEQIGGENAGRVGIAQSFLDDLPAIRQEVAQGGVTGVVDANVGRFGFGQQGRLYARIESGADALQRMLSGAGMPESEAAAYARRYMPTPSDTAEIVDQKLTQLERELSNQMGVVMRGRGGAPQRTPVNVTTMSDAELEAIANGR